MVIPPVVQSAEEWGEVPGAAVRVQREGGFLPDGYTTVISRVIRRDITSKRTWWHGDRGPSGLRHAPDGYPLDILLIGK